MIWYQWISLAALIYCSLVFTCRFARLLKMGSPKDLSRKSGDVGQAVFYSCTTAMAPNNKESAYMHLPTFTAGMLFHAGTFLSILAFLWFLVAPCLGVIEIPQMLIYIISAVLAATSLCGFAILIKRMVKSELRELSGFDDYFSNAITSLVQLFTAAYFLCSCVAIPYYLLVAIMFLWLPVGKTKHLLYFFFARYHLGFFYGWRGTWPPKKG